MKTAAQMPRGVAHFLGALHRQFREHLGKLPEVTKLRPRPVAFCPLVDGSTNTCAPYSRSFCSPSLQGRCAKFSNVPLPLKAITCGANCSSFCESRCALRQILRAAIPRFRAWAA